MVEALDRFLSLYPEWLTHSKTMDVDGRPELVVSTALTVALASWAADEGIIPRWKADKWKKWAEAGDPRTGTEPSE